MPMPKPTPVKNTTGWPVNVTEVALFYSATLPNYTNTILSDSNYYNLLYQAKSTGNTDELSMYLQKMVQTFTNGWPSNLAVIVSVEDESGPFANSTTDESSNCTLNSVINQLNNQQLANTTFSYNTKGCFQNSLYANGLGVDSWLGNFNVSGPSPLPHFRLGIVLLWFSC